MTGLLDGIVFCEEHGCPMLRIGDYYRCIFEYTDSLIGGRKVVDIVPAGHNTSLTLVFESGHALPLLCPDCGGPAHHTLPAGEVLAAVAGLRLIALGYGPPEGDEPEAFLLHLSNRLDAALRPRLRAGDEDVLTLATHTQSVAHLWKGRTAARSGPYSSPPKSRRRRRSGPSAKARGGRRR